METTNGYRRLETTSRRQLLSSCLQVPSRLFIVLSIHLYHQSLQRRTGAISAEISHIYTDNRLICVDSLQGGDIHDDDGEDVDHDTIRSNFELDSKEEF